MHETIGMIVPATMTLQTAIDKAISYNNQYDEWDYINEESARLTFKRIVSEVGGLLFKEKGYCQYDENEIRHELKTRNKNMKVLLFDVHI